MEQFNGSSCFRPDLSESNSVLLVFAVLLVASVVSLVASFRWQSVPGKYRQLWQLLSAFVLVISFGLVFFSAWTRLKFPAVCVEDDIVIIGEKRLPISSFRKIYVHQERSGNNLVQVGEAPVFRLLIMETEDKQYVFSEFHYRIDELYALMVPDSVPSPLNSGK
jgi:hypothetical protein